MFKNFFWFVRNPADEREQALYAKAYRQALMATWIAAAVIHFVSGWFGYKTPFTPYAVYALLLISSGAGWLTLRKEDLAWKHVRLERKPLLRYFILMHAILGVAAVALSIEKPEYVFLTIVLVIVAQLAIVMYWSWSWLRHAPTHTRVLATLFAATPSMVAVATQGQKTFWRTVQAVAATAVQGAYVVMVSVFVVLAAMPFRVTSDAFLPAAPNGSVAIVEFFEKPESVPGALVGIVISRSTTETAADGVVMHADVTSEIRYTFGRVQSVQDGTVTLLTQEGDLYKVPLDGFGKFVQGFERLAEEENSAMVFGRVETNPPFLWLERAIDLYPVESWDATWGFPEAP